MKSDTDTAFPALVEQIAALQLSMDIDDYELAKRLDMAGKNPISLVKAGKLRLPIDQLPILAHALNVPPLRFFVAALAETSPDGRAVLEFLVETGSVTRDDDKLIKGYRSALKRNQGVTTIQMPGAVVVVIPESGSTKG